MYPRGDSEDHGQSANQYPPCTHGHGQKGHYPEIQAGEKRELVLISLDQVKAVLAVHYRRPPCSQTSRNDPGTPEENRSGAEKADAPGPSSERCAPVPECGAVPKPGQESSSSRRSLVAVGRAQNSSSREIPGGVSCPVSRAEDAPAAGTLPGAQTPDGSLPVATFCAPRLSTHFYAARRSKQQQQHHHHHLFTTTTPPLLSFSSFPRLPGRTSHLSSAPPPPPTLRVS